MAAVARAGAGRRGAQRGLKSRPTIAGRALGNVPDRRSLWADVESVPMPFRAIQRIALTLTIGSAIFLGPALDARQTGVQSLQYRSPEGVDYRSLPIRMPSRAPEPRSTPLRGTSRASSTSASPSPVRGSFAKPSRHSHEGSRSSRRTRCFSDGAGIDIFPCVNSSARPPTSRAAAPSIAQSTDCTTSVSPSTCAETLPRRPGRSRRLSPSPRMPASWRVPRTGCGCR